MIITHKVSKSQSFLSVGDAPHSLCIFSMYLGCNFQRFGANPIYSVCKAIIGFAKKAHRNSLDPSRVLPVLCLSMDLARIQARSRYIKPTWPVDLGLAIGDFAPSRYHLPYVLFLLYSPHYIRNIQSLG